MSDVFEPKIRFSGISFAYNIAYALAGGFTPQLAVFLHTQAIQNPQSLMSYGLSAYVFALALAAFGTSLAMKRVYRV